MSRSPSSTFIQAINAQDTNEVFLILIEITHVDTGLILRVTSDAVDTVSNGNTYVHFPFKLTLPDDTTDEMPSAQLVIDNVDRTLLNALRSISTPPVVNIKIVLASDPDTVEVDLSGFDLSNVSYDQQSITGRLQFKTYIMEPFPGERFNPNEFPALF
ncbi:hypothetical protein LCGC14_1443930 [marine sediment metagenome]|uniref:DUF1833 domain-containing protein n=1 Tax=marine sediment metagenome TaxID=412755 RepID=A0A0F9M093_9ZZZZ